MGGLPRPEEDRSPLARFRTVEGPPIDREWRSLADGGEGGGSGDWWRDAWWNGVVGERRGIPRID